MSDENPTIDAGTNFDLSETKRDFQGNEDLEEQQGTTKKAGFDFRASKRMDTLSDTKRSSNVTVEGGSEPDGTLHDTEIEECDPFVIIEEAREEEEDKHQLEEDIFSLIFISNNRSQAFVYSFAVFSFQIWILVLILLDLYEDDDFFAKDNKFKAPVIKNDGVVVLAQYSALLVALISTDDVINTIRLVTVAYDPEIQKKHSSATRFRWIISNVCRCLEGLATVFVSFTFIVQSDSVLDIFMNFAAVEFISGLDNLLFELSKKGYLGKHIEGECKKVCLVQLKRTRLHLRRLQQAIFFIIVVFLVIGLAAVQKYQNDGVYLIDSSCSSLQITFGEDILSLSHPLIVTETDTTRNTSLFADNVLGGDGTDLVYSFFSGEYKAFRSEKRGKRLEYFERGREHDRTAGKFYYCEDDHAWVFTIPAMGENIPESEKCEDGWLMQSPVTDAASLEDAPTEGWTVWTGVVEQTSISVTCNDCYRQADCGMNHGYCVESERLCNCNEQWYGQHCEKELPACPQLQWVEYGDSSQDYYAQNDLYTTYFIEGYITTTIPYLVYDKPIYYLPDAADDGGSIDELVFYSGSRWVGAYWNSSRLNAFIDGGLDKIDLHSYWHLDDSLNVSHFSDTIDTDTPTGFTWNIKSGADSLGAVSTSELFGASYKVNAKYECYPAFYKDQPDKFCGSHGERNNVTDHCECTEAFGGTYCEFSPSSPYVQDQALAFVEMYLADKNLSQLDENNYHKSFWSNSKYTYDELNFWLKEDLGEAFVRRYLGEDHLGQEL